MYITCDKECNDGHPVEFGFDGDVWGAESHGDDHHAKHTHEQRDQGHRLGGFHPFWGEKSSQVCSSYYYIQLCSGYVPSVTEKTGPGIFAIKAELVD